MDKPSIRALRPRVGRSRWRDGQGLPRIAAGQHFAGDFSMEPREQTAGLGGGALEFRCRLVFIGELERGFTIRGFCRGIAPAAIFGKIAGVPEPAFGVFPNRWHERGKTNANDFNAFDEAGSLDFAGERKFRRGNSESGVRIPSPPLP